MISFLALGAPNVREYIGPPEVGSPSYWTPFAHIGTTDYLIGSSSYNSAVGSQAAGDPVWWLSCSAADAAAASAGKSIVMKLTMGEVVDYFRPTSGNSLCDMLASSTKHEFSPDEVTWYTPTYLPAGMMGGSAASWPRHNVPGDERAYLPFWGGAGANSGCCHSSLTSGAAWRQTFDLYVNTPPPAPPLSLVERCVSPVGNALADSLRIVGGTPLAYPREFPFMVSLFSHGSHVCGGSLIAPTWVLTAAHCTGGITQVKVGMHSSSCSTSSCDDCVQSRGVKRTIDHSQYSGSSLVHDISLLELSSPVDYPPIATYAGEGADLEAADTPVVVSGWGTLSYGGGRPDTPRKVTVPIYSDAACRQAYGASDISSGMVCAGLPQGGKDSCQGDSGGPLFYNEPGQPQKLVGIVSWGAGCAGPNKPGVYTRVSSYAAWLCQQTGSPYLCSSAASQMPPAALAEAAVPQVPAESGEPLPTSWHRPASFWRVAGTDATDTTDPPEAWSDAGSGAGGEPGAAEGGAAMPSETSASSAPVFGVIGLALAVTLLLGAAAAVLACRRYSRRRRPKLPRGFRLAIRRTDVQVDAPKTPGRVRVGDSSGNLAAADAAADPARALSRTSAGDSESRRSSESHSSRPSLVSAHI